MALLSILFLFNFVWCTDYADGYKTAKENNLPMIVVIGSPTCVACKKLDAELLTMDFGNRVAVKVDGDKNPDLIKKFNVKFYPTVILSDKNMKVTHFLQDEFTISGLRAILERDSK